MNQISIFANGEISLSEISQPLEGMIIAADGGARHCLRLGFIPQVVIGDFDSLSEADAAILQASGTEFIHYPADKDETDLELALDYAVKQGAQAITLYGLLGGRWDMSFANLLLLAAPRFAGIRFCVISGDTEAYILRGGETLEINGQPGNTVSAIPLSADVCGLTYTGLRWPLENAVLSFGTPRGVSNVLNREIAKISLENGLLLVMLIAKQVNG
ncbi:MAG TPA: thiamine diphosphokinase [Chloroflexi bacterium]|nr:thiamine diphosphokinase [Chloroflexota bacterium]